MAGAVLYVSSLFHPNLSFLEGKAICVLVPLVKERCKGDSEHVHTPHAVVMIKSLINWNFHSYYFVILSIGNIFKSFRKIQGSTATRCHNVQGLSVGDSR